MRALQRDTLAELRAAADSLEAVLETGTATHQDMLALVFQMRSWGSVLSGHDPAAAAITLH